MTNKTWRKSSFSGNENICTELAVEKAATYVRDSKCADGGSLRFPSGTFSVFLAEMKAEARLGA